MTVHLAPKTLEAIDRALTTDNGNTFRRWLGVVVPWMSAAFRDDEDGYRSHLGASGVGIECDRELYYQWHWANDAPPTGWKGEGIVTGHARMLRLWNRGSLEEARFIAMLLMIGVKMYTHDENGNQFRLIDFGGHFAGSLDGVGVGIPDLPADMPCLTEFKTMADKYFRTLKNDGLASSNWTYYIQMQIYMLYFGLKIGLFMAVDKDTDELHAELIPIDEPLARSYVERAKKTIFGNTLPSKLRFASPGYWKCRMCDMKDVCFKAKPPARNCRTCVNMRVQGDGIYCGITAKKLTKPEQIAGCHHYSIMLQMK